MKQLLFEFLTFEYPNIKYVVLGSILLSVSSAMVGCFTFLKKKALVGDVISHSVLPGICLSFIISGTKDPFLLIIGAFISGWFSVTVMDYIIANSKIKEDTATALVLSVFFGVGILLLTYIQHAGNAAQTGLDSFLFGKAAALVGTDLVAFASIAVLILIVVGLAYKEFKIIAFDPSYAKSIGIPVKHFEFLLSSVTVLAVVTGIQAVGVVLMAAMLITPAAAARFWTNRLHLMLILASAFAGFSGVVGAFISYASPAMPTGPWIVFVLSIIAILSFFVAPKRGILFKFWMQSGIQKKLLGENILKTFYALGEKDQEFKRGRTDQELLQKRDFTALQLKKGLKRLTSQGYIYAKAGKWELSNQGFEKGKRIQRLHRLWELYLTEYLRIAPDHVHEDAESIEHIITPELEKKLEKLLNYPVADPHQTLIPPKTK